MTNTKDDNRLATARMLATQSLDPNFEPPGDDDGYYVPHPLQAANMTQKERDSLLNVTLALSEEFESPHLAVVPQVPPETMTAEQRNVVLYSLLAVMHFEPIQEAHGSTSPKRRGSSRRGAENQRLH